MSKWYKVEIEGKSLGLKKYRHLVFSKESINFIFDELEIKNRVKCSWYEKELIVFKFKDPKEAMAFKLRWL